MPKTMCHKIESGFFSYFPDSRSFSTDASNLPEWFDPMRRVWLDACDAGFIMVSEKTGAEVIFTFEGKDTNGYDETAGWRFTAEVSANRKVISEDYRLLIAND